MYNIVKYILLLESKNIECSSLISRYVSYYVTENVRFCDISFSLKIAFESFIYTHF